MSIITNIKDSWTDRRTAYNELDKKGRRRYWQELLVNNSLYIFMVLVVIYVAYQNPRFISSGSIANIVSLTAANLPIALGIAGCIVLTGTDLSAGRIVGMVACMSAALLQANAYVNKMFPDMQMMHWSIVLFIVLCVGAFIGFANGLFTAKFSLHPFIVTLATQLIVYGFLLIFVQMGTNGGAPISGMDESYSTLIKGSFITIAGETIPNFVFYAIAMVIIMWFIWNKTTFGKNMFAVGSNPEAAKVSGVNVHRTIILVFTLAGIMYAFTGFIEGVRIGSNTPNTGAGAELDAIAACVIGGVSFVGGIGKIRGVIIGVLLLRLIFVGLQFLSVDANWQYIIKGLIILVACAIDMRKYLTRK